MLAREMYRHKYKKAPFMIQSRFTIFVHIGVIFVVYLLTSMNPAKANQTKAALLNFTGNVMLPPTNRALLQRVTN